MTSRAERRHELTAELEHNKHKIEKFEKAMVAQLFEVTSGTRRMTVRCDFLGNVQHIGFSESALRTLSATQTARLVRETMNDARAQPTKRRQEFYDRLTVGGESVESWKAHPPGPREPALFYLAQLQTLANMIPFNIIIESASGQ